MLTRSEPDSDIGSRSEQRRALQRWFSGRHEQAIATVHELIRGVRRQVVIVDPYFGRPELRFAVAVSRVVVPVSVLTSHDGLIEREKSGELQEAFVARVALFGERYPRPAPADWKNRWSGGVLLRRRDRHA